MDFMKQRLDDMDKDFRLDPFFILNGIENMFLLASSPEEVADKTIAVLSSVNHGCLSDRAGGVANGDR